MAKILLQTTIPLIEDDWHVGRFSLLKSELEDAGHEVTARNRDPGPGGNDPVLSTLSTQQYDQLWLMCVDAGNGLSRGDVEGILAFRERGGAILTARDHADLGASISGLGSLGIVNHFHRHNPERDETRRAADDRDNPDIAWPNYHSGANGDYQRITPVEPIHEILTTSTGGVITFFPAHPHEGAVDVPPGDPYARIVARGTSKHTHQRFNIAVTLDGEPCESGLGCKGRALAESTFHHFADVNWDASIAPPSFVRDRPGDGIARDPSLLATFKQYVRNVAHWLSR